jgi:Arc/MetJ-type ribon-helix-helix transcriptional regulator
MELIVRLDGDAERIVRELIDTGRCASAEEAVSVALLLLEGHGDFDEGSAAELARLIGEGAASGDAGSFDRAAIEREADRRDGPIRPEMARTAARGG